MLERDFGLSFLNTSLIHFVSCLKDIDECCVCCKGKIQVFNLSILSFLKTSVWRIFLLTIQATIRGQLM